MPKSRETTVAALTVAIRGLSGRAVLYSQAVAARLGINGTDLECLDFILTRGPATAGALAEVTGLTTGAVTGVIDRLEHVGLARRQADPLDRRKVLVTPAPDAGRRLWPLFAPMQSAVTEAFAAYSDRELDLLLGFFARAADAADRAMAELPPGRKAGPT